MDIPAPQQQQQHLASPVSRRAHGLATHAVAATRGSSGLHSRTKTMPTSSPLSFESAMQGGARPAVIPAVQAGLFSPL